MTQHIVYISILSLLLLWLINVSKAQTGEGCYLKTCSTAGQVRINAITDATSGAFLGGCNCGCPPELADPQHSSFCAEPKAVNYDPSTLQGDCSCKCPVGPNAPKPADCTTLHKPWNPDTCKCDCPPNAPKATDCVAPQIYNAETCTCACDIGNIGGPCNGGGTESIYGSIVTMDCKCDTTFVQCRGNQVADSTGKCGCPSSHNGLFLPACDLPLIQDPISCDCVTTTTTTPPPGPIDVLCESVGGLCSCPYGTQGTCTLTCDIHNDACKDGTIECNNDGYDCIVNCLTGSACAGAAKIIGPANGRLTVNCLGGQSCEGSVEINGDLCTDVSILCEGGQSCKGSINAHFGKGQGSIACNGVPDSCVGMQASNFILPIDAEITPGVSFQCTGQCPPNAPAPFSNIAVQTHTPPYTPPHTAPQIPGLSPPYTPPITIPQIPGLSPPYNPNPIVPTPPPIPRAPVAPGAHGGTIMFNVNPPIPITQPDEIVVCEGVGSICDCSGTRSCTIKCETQDSCKEATLNCSPHHDCTVVCMGDASCISATINGPINKDFTLNAAGVSSCVDTNINAADALNTAYTCSGKDACKGATYINCGMGNCEIACPGEAACDSAFILPNSAKAFFCSGAVHCPPAFTEPPVFRPTTPPTPPCHNIQCTCNNALQCFEQPNESLGCQCECPLSILTQEYTPNPDTICGLHAPGQIYMRGQCACNCPIGTDMNCPTPLVFNQNTCKCECPGGNMQCGGKAILNEKLCQCECPAVGTPTVSDCAATGKVLRDCECQCPLQCPGTGQIQSPSTCQCSCPSTTPSTNECVSGIIDELLCQCKEPEPSPYCCHPKIDDFKPWRGRCWGLTTENECMAEPNGRCVWKGLMVNGVSNPFPQMLPNPPYNDLLPSQPCKFRDVPCASNVDCCSEVCRITGFCR